MSERRTAARGEGRRRGGGRVATAPFPADLNYPGSFSCQRQRAVHSINQARVTRLECPSTRKRERTKGCEAPIESGRDVIRNVARIHDYSQLNTTSDDFDSTATIYGATSPMV